MSVEKLYEDAAVAVVIKPSDLVSEQTGDGSGLGDLLAAENGGYIGVIHRLDRGVGGVTVYAKTKSAAAKLSQDVQNNAFEKEYLAIVHGKPAPRGEFCDLLFHDRQKNRSYIVDRVRAGVKEAKLTYQAVASALLPSGEEVTLCRIRLQTGRTHQIRVQFSGRGFPLVGDGKYGAHDRTKIKLACISVCFQNPATGRKTAYSFTPTGEEWDLFPPLSDRS